MMIVKSQQTYYYDLLLSQMWLVKSFRAKSFVRSSHCVRDTFGRLKESNSRPMW